MFHFLTKTESYDQERFLNSVPCFFSVSGSGAQARSLIYSRAAQLRISVWGLGSINILKVMNLHFFNRSWFHIFFRNWWYHFPWKRMASCDHNYILFQEYIFFRSENSRCAHSMLFNHATQPCTPVQNLNNLNLSSRPFDFFFENDSLLYVYKIEHPFLI